MAKLDVGGVLQLLDNARNIGVFVHLVVVQVINPCLDSKQVVFPYVFTVFLQHIFLEGDDLVLKVGLNDLLNKVSVSWVDTTAEGLKHCVPRGVIGVIGVIHED